MKKFLSIFLFVLAALFFSQVLSGKAVAQTTTPSVSPSITVKSSSTNITVTVAGNSLSVSGYLAPFASISLVINGNVITAVTADKNGNFTFSNVAIPKTATLICFDAVDYKNLGQSEACLSITPTNGLVTKTDVFLPPTLGIQRTEVEVGSNATAFGYGMPGATITVHVSSAAGCTVVADDSGYYQCSIAISNVGNYELYADAVLNGKPSEQQLKKILLKGVALQVIPTVPGFGQLPSLVTQLFAIPWWVWVLLALIVIILIIIRLRQNGTEALPAIGVLPIVPSLNLKKIWRFFFRQRKLHHWWMRGVGY